jgi:hypothetical protein
MRLLSRCAKLPKSFVRHFRPEVVLASSPSLSLLTLQSNIALGPVNASIPHLHAKKEGSASRRPMTGSVKRSRAQAAWRPEAISLTASTVSVFPPFPLCLS